MQGGDPGRRVGRAPERGWHLRRREFLQGIGAAGARYDGRCVARGGACGRCETPGPMPGERRRSACCWPARRGRRGQVIACCRVRRELVWDDAFAPRAQAQRRARMVQRVSGQAECGRLLLRHVPSPGWTAWPRTDGFGGGRPEWHIEYHAISVPRLARRASSPGKPAVVQRWRDTRLTERYA